MTNKPTHTTAIPVVLIAALCFCDCAGPKPAVFDKASIAKVHKLMVVPMRTSLDSSTGPIVAEMAAERLQVGMAAHDDFAILMAPSLSAPGRIRPHRASGAP